MSLKDFLQSMLICQDANRGNRRLLHLLLRWESERLRHQFPPVMEKQQKNKQGDDDDGGGDDQSDDDGKREERRQRGRGGGGMTRNDGSGMVLFRRSET